MDPLTPARRRELRARAHPLHPVVAVGSRGLTPAVLREIDRALTAHELVKLRVLDDDRDERTKLFAHVCAELGCAPVQHLGKLLILWRKRPPAAKDVRPASPGSRNRPPKDATPAPARRRSASAPRAPAGVPRAVNRRRRRGR